MGEQERDKRNFSHREHRWENSRPRINRDQDHHRPREWRDTELNDKENKRQPSSNYDRNDSKRQPDERHYSSSRKRDHDVSNDDQRYDRHYRRREEDSSRRKDRVESKIKET